MSTARILHACRTTGRLLPKLPSPPLTIEEAYANQDELTSEFLKDGYSKIIGWKIANTNPSSQTFLKTTKPFFGPLLESGAARFVNVGLIEPEVAFKLGQDLEPIEMAPAIEIVHSSFEDWRSVGLPSLILGLACNGAWYRGSSVPFDEEIFKKPLEIRLKFNGKLMSVGSADRVMNESPLKALEWLKLHAGEKLRPGDWITTGVCVDPPYETLKASGKGVFVAEFEGGLGNVTYLNDLSFLEIP